MMTDSALMIREEMNLADTMTLGKTLSASGYFDDASQAAQAVVKILAGRELGLGPIASMTGIHIIKKKVTLGANLMAATVKRDPRYDYRVIEMEDSACEIVFFEQGAEIGRSRFTAKDAQRAGTQNMSKFPRNMLFARAMSNGVRWYCPDAFGGAPVYTPDELGATVDDEGGVIEMPALPQPPRNVDHDADAAEAKRELDGLDEWPDTPSKPADLDYVPDWIDSESTGQWTQFRQEACEYLGYKHVEHVKNTLKSLVDEDERDDLTYRTAWHLLAEHQRSKENE